MENKLIVTETKNEIIKNCSNQLKYFIDIPTATKKFNSYNEIFQYKTIRTLNKIKIELGEEKINAHLRFYLMDLVMFFNIKNSFTETQINSTAEFIISEFGMLNLADITLFFKRFKTGYFGEIYNRIDGQVLLICMKKYLEERLECAENYSYKEHSQTKINNFENNKLENLFENNDYKRAKHEYEINKINIKKTI